MSISRTIIRSLSWMFQAIISIALLSLAAVQQEWVDVVMGLFFGGGLAIGAACSFKLALDDIDAELKSGYDT